MGPDRPGDTARRFPHAALGRRGRRAQLWDVADGRVLRLPLGTIHGPDGKGFMSAAFGPDGTIVATTSTDGTGQVWDVAEPQAPRPLGIPLLVGDLPLASGFSADGSGLYFGNKAGKLIHYDLRGLSTLPADPVAAACDRAGAS